MEEVSVSIKSPPSIKETYSAKNGIPVTLDYFLYICLEMEHTYRSLKPKAAKQITKARWPVLTGPHDFKDLEIKDVLTELFDWYSKKFPLLASDKPLDYMLSSDLLNGFVLLSMDVISVAKEMAGVALPFVNNDNSQNPEGQKVWQTLESLIDGHFPTFSHYMASYLRWSFQKTKPKVYDLASLPPVGRFLPMLYRSQKNRDRNDRSRGPRRDSPQASRTSDRPMRPDRSERGPDRPERSERTERPERGSARASRPRDAKPKAREDGVDAAREKEAGIAVTEACDVLKKNPQLAFLALEPQNSYIRRLQHKMVEDMGFHSVSEGEGAKRCIKIQRKS